MKKVLQVLAIATHPVFLPIFSLLVYAPLVAYHGPSIKILAAIWVAFVYLILPLIFLKLVRKVDFNTPGLEGRKSIYKTYTLINAGFIAVNIFVFSEYVSFFIGFFFLHLLLWFLIFIELKASWHAAAWSFLVFAGLLILYRYQMAGLDMKVFAAFVILLVVCATRYFQKAHSLFELGMGVAAGAITSSIILFF